MKGVVKLMLPIFFILIIVTPSLALKPEASVDVGVVSPTLYGWSVPYGQKIAFKVRVCVKGNSPAPLDGFFIKIVLQKPNGETSVAEFTKDDKINPGECREYIFQLNQKADKVGTWSYVTVLFTRDGQYKLDIDTGYFKVVESGGGGGGGGGLPVAKMEILKIEGKVGEKIKVSVRICVDKYSPPLNGFKLLMSFWNPDYGRADAEWECSDTISPGQCKVYTIETDVTAAKAGTWSYAISLVTKDSSFLDFKHGTFEVGGAPASPVAEVEVLNVFGYTVAASMIGAVLALALSRMIK